MNSGGTSISELKKKNIKELVANINDSIKKQDITDEESAPSKKSNSSNKSDIRVQKKKKKKKTQNTKPKSIINPNNGLWNNTVSTLKDAIIFIILYVVVSQDFIKRTVGFTHDVKIIENMVYGAILFASFRFITELIKKLNT